MRNDELRNLNKKLNLLAVAAACATWPGAAVGYVIALILVLFVFS